MAKAKQRAPRACAVRMGARLAERLNSEIDAQATEERDRAAIIQDMADEAGIDPGTVDQILAGEINCPPLDRLEGFGRALDVAVDGLVSAAEADGCVYGDEDEDPAAAASMPVQSVGNAARRFGLMAEATIELHGPVGADMFGEGGLTAAKLRAALAGVGGDVTVALNSGGGDAFEGAAIHAVLKAHEGRVTVVVEGIAASAASLIAMAGDEIVMAEGALMMIHDPSGMVWGTADDMAHTADALDKIATEYAGIYARRSGMSVEEARELMRAETWMTAAEAVEKGFADRVLPGEGAVAAFPYQVYAHAPRALVQMAVQKNWLADGPRADRATRVAELEEDVMSKITTPVAGAGQDVQELKATADAVLMAERGRVTAIHDVAAKLGLDAAAVQAAVADGVSADAFRASAIDMVAQRGAAQTRGIGGPVASVVSDGRDRLVMGATRGLMARAGLKGGERNEFSGLTLSELARETLHQRGESRGFADRRQMVGRAFTMAAGAHSTSDFAQILSNLMGKGALAGWEESEETYQLWTRQGVLTDFKATKRVGLGLVDSLPEKIEGADYTYGTVGDRGESIALATYGKILKVTREAIINDDLDQLTSVPRRMGRAARRTIGNLVYSVLTANPLMSDGVALFAAGHNNLAGTAAAPSVTSFGAARAAMRTQKEAAGGANLNITPRYVLSPAALETTISQLLTSVVDPGANKGHASNPVAGLGELVVDGRLDAASATAWYLAADPNAFDTIEVAFLDGQSEPFLEEQTDWHSDGVEMKVRIDAGVAPLDFRTLYKNAGA